LLPERAIVTSAVVVLLGCVAVRIALPLAWLVAVVEKVLPAGRLPLR